MRKLINAIIIFSLLIQSGCLHIPLKDFTVGQRGDNRTVNTDCGCDDDQLTEPVASRAGLVKELDSKGFSLMNWNILKGARKGWTKDFQRLCRDSDLLIIQEAYLTDELRQLLRDREYNWDLTNAFEYKEIETGVLTACKIAPDFLCAFRAEEPFTAVPKSILITRYPMSDTEQSLLVANIHSINFTLGTADFRNQLQRMEQVLAKHQGPLILAGDFNTWSEGRMAIVKAITAKLQMKAVTFAENNRVEIFGRNIDHIYYRGLETLEAVASKVTTSDHNPMQVTFRLASGQ